MSRRFLLFLSLILCSCAGFAQSVAVDIIPFRFIDGHLIIKVRVNDASLMNFMFDSGAGGTLISATAAKKLGLIDGIERTNTGAVGTHEVQLHRGNKIAVGDVEIEGVTLMADSEDFEELEKGSSLDGIIGYHILSNYVVTVDFDNNQLILFNPREFDSEKAGKPYSFDLTNNIPLIQASVTLSNGNSFNGKFLVDTGARSGVILSSPTVKEYNLVENIGDNYVLRTTLGSSRKRTKIMYGRVEEVGLFGDSFNYVPAVLSSSQKGLLSSDEIHGIIGTPLLKRFNLTFDYTRGLIYANPSLTKNDQFETNVAGFSISFRGGKPFIKDLIDRSNADKAGLRNDDEIISINGVVVENMQGWEIRQSLAEENKLIKIVIRRNGKLKYTEMFTQAMI